MMGILIGWSLTVFLSVAALISFAKFEHDASLMEEGLDPSVDFVLTLGDDEDRATVRDLWRRVKDSHLLRLSKRIRLRRHRRSLVTTVPTWN